MMTTAITDGMEILTTRVFPVQVEALYAAFSTPEHLARWWGPDGFTNRITRFDLHPGGEWHITMTNSDGLDFHNRCTFEIVVPGERIFYVHHEPMHVFTMDMFFATAGGDSRLTWKMTFERNRENLEIRKFIAAANEQNFDRLGRLLEDLKGK